MELERLRTFVSVVREGSLSAAARAVGRTQPAVTVQIQRLEQAVGEPLLVRGARGVRPTRAGDALYARAGRLLREAEEMVAEVRALSGLAGGRLRVGATDVMALHLLPRVLMRFRRRHPGVQVTVSVAGSRALEARVRRGDLDLGLVTLPVPEEGLDVREVHREPLQFVAAPDHRLARQRRVTLRRLAAEALIHHAADSITREAVEAVFRVRGLEPRVAMEVSSPEAIKALVALGLGIAPLSRSQVSVDLRAGRLAAVAAPGFRCWRRSGIVMRRGAPALRTVSAFAAMLPQPAGRR